MKDFMFMFFLIGIAGGLLGIFYRNCLKVPNMIFTWWYDILSKWVYKGDVRCMDGKCTHPTKFWRMMAWIARPLGYCIYCSTQWIVFILCYLFMTTFAVLPYWQDIVIGIVLASGVSHVVACLFCKYIIPNNSDLDY